MINSCQKTGDASLTGKDMELIASVIKEKYDEINEKLKSLL